MHTPSFLIAGVLVTPFIFNASRDGCRTAMMWIISTTASRFAQIRLMQQGIVLGYFKTL
jgi:hypothetical protein